MHEDGPPLIPIDARGDWLRLRTLLLLRWLALLGQSAAVLVAGFGLGFDLRLDLIALVIGALAAFNLGVEVRGPGNRRLSEREVTATLLFDLCQLGALLYLSGGLGNPFALLLLAPVTVSATVLSLRATVLLAAVACAIITGLLAHSLPLRLASGEILALPPLLMAGSWASLVIGMVFLALYARRVTQETFAMSRALAATQMALGREQRVAALGGIVAAAAHELGTPLATIKLVSTELVEELAAQPELREDALLIRAQADRCRDILRALDTSGAEDGQPHHAPFSSLVEEAAAPHLDRGIRVILRVEGAPLGHGPSVQPAMARRPEIVQGLRNLIQNAVDFARATVWIDLSWSATEIRAVIGDDGPGYPPELLGRIGEPFLRRRGGAQRGSPGYEGMGLGLFIAKTLLERTGAELDFANAAAAPENARETPLEFSRPAGAVVSVVWPRARAEQRAAPEAGRARAGEARGRRMED